MTLATGLASCRQGKTAESDIDAEQARLEQISHIDTMALRAMPPDAITSSASLDSLTADAWMLIDDSTGIVISARNAFQRRYMASLTKMMTALMVLEKGQLTDTVVITDDVCVYDNAYVKPGDAYVLGDLICEMMMKSDNNAAYALAKHVAGDTLAFYDMMNSKAKYLGMDSTHFANPNGMPNNDNYSSAADLTKLARYCMRDSTFAAIVGTTGRNIPLTDGRYQKCYNGNELIRTYEGCTGIKSGYTLQAGFCLAASATRNGTSLTLVLLNSRTSDRRFTESAALLDYGFRMMRAYKQSAAM